MIYLDLNLTLFVLLDFQRHGASAFDVRTEVRVVETVNLHTSLVRVFISFISFPTLCILHVNLSNALSLFNEF